MNRLFVLVLLIIVLVIVDWIFKLSAVGVQLSNMENNAFQTCLTQIEAYPSFFQCDWLLVSNWLLFKLVTVLMLFSAIRLLLMSNEQQLDKSLNKTE